jgi:cytochrome P450
MNNTTTPLSIAQLPGPKAWPLLGNLLQIKLAKTHLIFEHWASLYGPIYTFKMLQKPVVVISDPNLIHTMLKERPHNYRRGGAIETMFRELGAHGVFSAEGEQWQQQRQWAQQALRPEQLRQFFPNLCQIIARLHHRWVEAINAAQLIDLKKDWMRFTVDITTQFAFGYDINLLQQQNDQFQHHLEKVLPTISQRINAPLPYWHYVKLPSDYAIEKSLAIVHATIQQFIEQARHKLAQSVNPQASNFLETLLLMQADNGNGLEEADIQGNIVTLLLAGEDTTSHTLSWLVHLLATHPEVVHKIQQEVDAVLGEQPYPQAWEIVNQLPYIEAVVHETMRLKSVAPIVFLETNHTVELAGVEIPKGILLMLMTRYGALQEENFVASQQFMPERWLDNAALCPHNRQAHLPFGAGPRFCPGRGLALLEMKMAIAMLCKSFTVQPIDHASHPDEVFAFTMVPNRLDVKLMLR